VTAGNGKVPPGRPWLQGLRKSFRLHLVDLNVNGRGDNHGRSSLQHAGLLFVVERTLPHALTGTHWSSLRVSLSTILTVYTELTAKRGSGDDIPTGMAGLTSRVCCPARKQREWEGYPVHFIMNTHAQVSRNMHHYGTRQSCLGRTVAACVLVICWPSFWNYAARQDLHCSPVRRCTEKLIWQCRHFPCHSNLLQLLLVPVACHPSRLLAGIAHYVCEQRMQ
jgi:hypothetical protein